MADIEISAGGAHYPESARRDHVHFLRGSFHAFFLRHLDYFLGGKHHGLTRFNLFVDFCYCLGHYINPLFRTQASWDYIRF
jgi:predicted ATPase